MLHKKIIWSVQVHRLSPRICVEWIGCCFELTNSSCSIFGPKSSPSPCGAPPPNCLRLWFPLHSCIINPPTYLSISIEGRPTLPNPACKIWEIQILLKEKYCLPNPRNTWDRIIPPSPSTSQFPRFRSSVWILLFSFASSSSLHPVSQSVIHSFGLA